MDSGLIHRRLLHGSQNHRHSQSSFSPSTCTGTPGRNENDVPGRQQEQPTRLVAWLGKLGRLVPSLKCGHALDFIYHRPAHAGHCYDLTHFPGQAKQWQLAEEFFRASFGRVLLPTMIP